MPPAPSKQCLTRLQRELKSLRDKPETMFAAAPDPDNILTWLFVFDGPADTVYAGGRYVGELRFPPEYPFKPPDIKMRTPSGRFDVNTLLCMSNSSFHPESWSPMWGVSTILTGFISFFASNETTMGSVDDTEAHRKEFAANSAAYNYQNLKSTYGRALPQEYEKDGICHHAGADDVPPPAKKDRRED